jgi:hypothetical protein
MLTTLLGWLSGGIVGQIGDQLNRAHEARLKAQNEEQRVAADKMIEDIRFNRDILVSQHTPLLDKIVRPLFALPIAFYFGKVIMWDKALGLGSTPDLTPQQWNLAMLVAGAYFGVSAVERLFRGRR